MFMESETNLRIYISKARDIPTHDLCIPCYYVQVTLRSQDLEDDVRVTSLKQMTNPVFNEIFDMDMTKRSIHHSRMLIQLKRIDVEKENQNIGFLSTSIRSITEKKIEGWYNIVRETPSISSHATILQVPTRPPRLPRAPPMPEATQSLPVRADRPASPRVPLTATLPTANPRANPKRTSHSTIVSTGFDVIHSSSLWHETSYGSSTGVPYTSRDIHMALSGKNMNQIQEGEIDLNMIPLDKFPGFKRTPGNTNLRQQLPPKDLPNGVFIGHNDLNDYGMI